jgi:hypothetical protein
VKIANRRLAQVIGTELQFNKPLAQLHLHIRSRRIRKRQNKQIPELALGTCKH